MISSQKRKFEYIMVAVAVLAVLTPTSYFLVTDHHTTTVTVKGGFPL